VTPYRARCLCEVGACAAHMRCPMPCSPEKLRHQTKETYCHKPTAGKRGVAQLFVHLEGAANFGMPPAERATSKKKKEAQQIWQGGLPGGPTWPSSALSARTRSGKPKSATAPLEADQQRLRRLVEREGAVVDIVAAAVDAGMDPQAVHVELLIT